MLDLALTYPCSIPFYKDGNAQEGTADGHKCIYLFTDDDLHLAFIQHTYPPGQRGGIVRNMQTVASY
jgi:hypothetical protein